MIAIAVVAQLVLQGSLSVAIAVFVLAYMQRIGSQLFVLSELIAGFDRILLDAQPMTEMLLASVASSSVVGSGSA